MWIASIAKEFIREMGIRPCSCKALSHLAQYPEDQGTTVFQGYINATDFKGYDAYVLPYRHSYEVETHGPRMREKMSRKGVRFTNVEAFTPFKYITIPVEQSYKLSYLTTVWYESSKDDHSLEYCDYCRMAHILGFRVGPLPNGKRMIVRRYNTNEKELAALKYFRSIGCDKYYEHIKHRPIPCVVCKILYMRHSRCSYRRREKDKDLGRNI